MSKQDIKSTLKPLLKNRYVLTVLGFFVWMVLIDSDSIFYRYQLSQKVSSLEQERDNLKETISRDYKKMQELKSSKESLEKFAREEYYMKKDDEVIFIVKE